MQYAAEQRREYMQRYREGRRAWARKTLGGKCAKCGSQQNLEFDHINPEAKVAAIASMLTASWEKFVAEVMKCQLLCRSHHLAVTRARREALPLKHGAESTYRNGCRCSECTMEQKQRRKRHRKAGANHLVVEPSCKEGA